MEVRQFFSSLNILYLKLFQYEKHVDSEQINNIIEHINSELEWLKGGYDKELKLSNMSLNDMFEHCVISSSFNHKQSESLIEAQLMSDLNQLQSVSEKVLVAHMQITA